MPDAGPVVVYSGGGTGGHLYPALALADEVARLRPDVHAHFVGASRGIEARVLPEQGREHTLLPVEGFQRGGGLMRSLGVVIALGRSLIEVVSLFRRIRPSAVVVTGGYAGGPSGIVAGALGIPLVVQEQNSVPGKTVRLLSVWAREVHVAFPEATALLPRTSHVECTGNPVRVSDPVPRAEARARFGLSPDGVVLLVVGGSQGSRAMNETLSASVARVAAGELRRPERLEILWSTGPTHIDGVRGALEAAGTPSWVHAVPYIDDMPAALSAADFAVSRAGAMATAELLSEGLPAILIPLPTAAADHQTENARALTEADAAVMLVEAGLTTEQLWSDVAVMAGDPARRQAMAVSARERARPHATTTIAERIVRLLPARKPA